jgi:hypothetical protein
MANPRVFLSSTCYDLAEVRDSLHAFISGVGFDPCLSERGDVFYHPDLHTHDSCLNEVSNCHLFILIIGGRFGGSYVAETSKSIVNAEYSAARQLGLPIFTFVKRQVWSDHRVFQTNRDNAAAINFPSIDRQEHAPKIFTFIDEVRLAPTNNGFFDFEYASEIVNLLRKQWAGMFFEALHQRKQMAEAKAQTALLGKLTSTTEQMEQLVKMIYQRVDEASAPSVIKNVEMRSDAAEFFRELANMYEQIIFGGFSPDDLIREPLPASWVDFVARTSEFEVANVAFRISNGKNVTLAALRPAGGGRAYPVVPIPEAPNATARIARLEKNYAALRSLSLEDKKQVFAEFKDLNARKYAQTSESESEDN